MIRWHLYPLTKSTFSLSTSTISGLANSKIQQISIRQQLTWKWNLSQSTCNWYINWCIQLQQYHRMIRETLACWAIQWQLCHLA
jgi:hypothetical protein